MKRTQDINHPIKITTIFPEGYPEKPTPADYIKWAQWLFSRMWNKDDEITDKELKIIRKHQYFRRGEATQYIAPSRLRIMSEINNLPPKNPDFKEM